MKLRKIVKSLVVLCAVSLATACTDLVPKEVDSVVVTGAGAGSGANPTDLLVSSYKDLGVFTDQANIYALNVHTSDELIPPTRGVDWGDNGVWRTLHQHTWDATHAWVLNSWNQLNQRIFKANQILASGPTPAQAAEAKFLRAFFMWHVMDFFGQVPIRNVTDGPTVNPKVLSRSEAFDAIEKDLVEALPGLAGTGPQAKNASATKAAANAMLARLYLNKAVYKASNPTGPYTFDNADMDKVIQYASAVQSAGYSLEDNYFDNFSTDASKEIILTSAEGSPSNRWFMTLHYSQKPSGWNGFATMADFYAKFEPTDGRRSAPAPVAVGKEFFGIKRGFLAGQQVDDNGANVIDSRTQKPLSFTFDVPLSGAATDKGIRVIKYHPANAGQYILLRYADVFLMGAEAKLRKGDAAGALADVNALRSKRGASALTSVGLPQMLDERGRELYWEGIRRVDQVRFGTFTGTWSEKTVTDPNRVLFPIPQQAIDSNPNLKQNAGYGGN